MSTGGQGIRNQTMSNLCETDTFTLGSSCHIIERNTAKLRSIWCRLKCYPVNFC